MLHRRCACWGEKALNWNAIGTPFGTLCGHSDAEMEHIGTILEPFGTKSGEATPRRSFEAGA